MIPGHYGIVCDTVRFKSDDGVTLQGWFFPAQDTAGIANQWVGRLIPVPEVLRSAPRPYPGSTDHRAPTIVICGGDAGNMSYLILHAYQFFTHGFNVLTFDWRGFGESDPWPTRQDQLVYAEYLLDYEAAIDYAKSRPESEEERIGLLGFSTGAYLSFAMAARRRDIRALAVRALMTSFDELLPVIRKLDPARRWHAPADYPRELLPLPAAGKLSTPVLLVVGEQDERTPPWMSERVHRRLTGAKELWVVRGAGHGGQAAPELVAHAEFFARVRSFFRRHLAGEAPGD